MRETKVMTCPKGHTEERRWSERRGRWSRCPVCEAARGKAYRKANPDKRRATQKAYYEANKEFLKPPAANSETQLARLAQKKAYRDANREKVRARNKAYREANREKVRARKKAYCEANREKVSARKKAYYEANRERINAARREKQRLEKERRDNGEN
jgi:hypothetical protein